MNICNAIQNDLFAADCYLPKGHEGPHKHHTVDALGRSVVYTWSREVVYPAYETVGDVLKK